jgi:putative tryptophan/tyrosine transport system substrate-binding protein
MKPRMRRRDVMAAISAAALSLPAYGQPSARAVIAYLSARSSRTDGPMLAALRQGLKEIGYIEGSNLSIEYRWGEGRYERLPALASDLVRQQVAVIVTGGGEVAALAAKAATSSIPIVFNVGGDPLRSGLVSSLNRPGSNLTGVSSFLFTLGAKQLDVLREMVRGADPIGILANPLDPGFGPRIDDTRAAADALRQTIAIAEASTEEELERAFQTFVQQGVRAVAIMAGPFFVTSADRLIHLAARYQLPTMYFRREFALAGGLVSYGSDTAEGYRQMGVYAGRILNGSNPGDLPIVQPTKFELIINLKTAKALGLIIPPTLLARADEVIE